MFDFQGDPFANDPFFSDKGFGSIDKMISEMKSDMRRGTDNPHMMNQMGKMGSGKFT